MPDIGASLREARMRLGVDITEVEERTRIRAKYLRALENEEWHLLPGQIYVKSFLRTYAQAVGLDAKVLVEEYKLRHERLSDVETQPIAPPGSRQSRPPSPRVPRGIVIGLILLVLFGALYVLGRGATGKGDKGTASTSTAQTTSVRTTAATTPRRKPRATPVQPRRVGLRLVPSGPVYVCLRAGNRTLIAGQTITAPTRTFRARRFTMTLGNGSVALRVDGRAVNVAESADPIGLAVTRKGRRTLGAGARPTCGG